MQISMWHGGRKWDALPEIQGPRKGRAELGPGIYLSNHYETCRGFAKGGGVVRNIVMTPNLILEQAALSLSDACDFVTSVIVKSKQRDIIERMVELASRHRLEGRALLGSDNQRFHAESLVNLCVNGDLTLGAKGLALAEFLADQGIDCSFSHRSGKEYWGTIYNIGCINTFDVVPANKVEHSHYELPDPFAQIQAQIKRAEYLAVVDRSSLGF